MTERLNPPIQKYSNLDLKRFLQERSVPNPILEELLASKGPPHEVAGISFKTRAPHLVAGMSYEKTAPHERLVFSSETDQTSRNK